jgi:hypothetical protein
LSGIYANKPGYHNCRNQLPSSDYSVQKSYDQKGDGWAAGALDITLSDADMKKFTQRLIDETKKNGDKGKLKALREFFGTTNGYDVTGMDVPGQYFISSDDSHLWHVHCSSKREYANDKAAWQDVASVILGTSTPPEDDDMPKQIYLYSKSGQTTKLGKSGTWVAVNWDADLASTGGVSLCLPKGATLFSMTAWLYFGNLPPDYNMYWRVQTLDAATSEEFAKFPIGEIRGTTGDTDLCFSQIGSVNGGKQTNLRILVASTQTDSVVKQAWWRCLYW